jgi:diguanylate cyclase (GGDEF)-like protein
VSEAGVALLPDRYKLILRVSLVLTAGFLATSLTSYYTSKAAIHDAIVANELPLTSDTIYSEIQLINYRLPDHDGKFPGVTGVGLTVDAVSRLLHDYRARFGRRVYFLDTQGKVVLADSGGAGGSIRSIEGISALADQILSSRDSGRYQYQQRGNTHLLNVRYIADLKWYLCVERIEDEALGEIRQTLVMNLAAFLVVTAIVLLLVGLTVNRYHLKLEALATTDTLTGLINRRAFDLHLLQGLEEARRKKQPLSAVMIDIDHFKQLNDAHGHLCGDQVLREMAVLVKECLRQSDVACRWGGEELFVLLKEADEPAAVNVAEKIRSAVETHRCVWRDAIISLTISLGVAEFLGPDDDAGKLIARADEALYAAKHGGRNRVCRSTEVSQT